MISRKALFSILLGIAGVLIMTWRIGFLPGRVVVINQSGVPLSRVAITTEAGRIEVGSIGVGQTRRVSVSPSATLRFSFDMKEPHVWSSPKGVTAGQSVVLYVTVNGNVDARDRIGEFGR